MAPLTDMMREALELQAAYEKNNSETYLTIANFWDALNYDGIAKYYRAEAENEKKHRLAVLDYITRRNRLAHPRDLRDYAADAIAPEIAGFNSVIKEALEAGEKEENYGIHFFKLFKLAYDLECFNTARFNKIAQLAQDHGDHVTYEFCLYFLREQGEAEDVTDMWMSKAKAYGAMPGLFWHLDVEMKKAAEISAHPPTLNYGGLYK